MLLSIFRDFRVSTITGLDWTGLQVSGTILATASRKWLFASVTSVMVGLLNDYEACLQQGRVKQVCSPAHWKLKGTDRAI